MECGHNRGGGALAVSFSAGNSSVFVRFLNGKWV